MMVSCGAFAQGQPAEKEKRPRHSLLKADHEWLSGSLFALFLLPEGEIRSCPFPSRGVGDDGGVRTGDGVEGCGEKVLVAGSEGVARGTGNQHALPSPKPLERFRAVMGEKGKDICYNTFPPIPSSPPCSNTLPQG